MTFMRALAIASCLTSACYTYYPKKVPDLNGALLVEGQPIKLHVKSQDRTESCDDYQLSAGECRVGDDGRVRHPYTRRTATASYGGRDLTHNELYQLAMADYPERIRGIHARKGTCELSFVPTAIAVAAAIAAIAVPLYFSTQLSDDQQKTIYYSAAGVTLGASLASYPIGGYACVKSKELAGNLLEDADSTEWIGGALDDFSELHEMVNAFNAKHATAAPADDGGAGDGGAPSEPPSGDE